MNGLKFLNKLLITIILTLLSQSIGYGAVPIVPGGVGAQKTLVISLAPPGGSFVANQALIDFVMGQVDDAYRRASNNQTWYEGVKNPGARADTFFYTLKTFNPATCDAFTWGNEAIQAANIAGYPLSSYKLTVFALPNSSCGGHGFTIVGSDQAYANGSNQVTFRVFSHEIGHGRFRWQHSSLWGCSAYVDCGYSEYGDSRDVMSNTGEDDINGFERERAGWAKYPVVGPGTYTLPPFNELGDPNTKAIKVAVPGTTKMYYFTYRPESGGIYVHLADEMNSDSLVSRWVSWVGNNGGLFTSDDMLDDTRGVFATAKGNSVTISTIHPVLGPGYVLCATTFQNCSIPPGQTATVAVGVKFTWQYFSNVTGLFSCPQTPSIAGDNSACWMKVGGTPPPPTVSPPTNLIVNIITNPTVNPPTNLKVSVLP